MSDYKSAVLLLVLSYLLEYAFVQFPFDVFFEVSALSSSVGWPKSVRRRRGKLKRHVDEGVVLGRLVVIFGHNAGRIM